MVHQGSIGGKFSRPIRAGSRGVVRTVRSVRAALAVDSGGYAYELIAADSWREVR